MPRPSIDLGSLLVDGAVDLVEPQGLLEEHSLLTLDLKFPDLAFEPRQRVL